LKSYERKAQLLFGDRLVNKELARRAGLPRLPQYVVEWLVANFVKQGSENEDLRRLRERVAEVLPDAERREEIKAALMHHGKVTVFDKLDVHVDLRTGTLVGTLNNLGLNDVSVPKILVERIPRLLTGGVWGAIILTYHHATGKKGSTGNAHAQAMTAFQEPDRGLDVLAGARAQFTTQEWVDLLLASLGYNPEKYQDWRVKMLLLTRLLPAIEANANLIELGPRQTGKTYLLRNVSTSVYTASGANVTAASLFANASSGNPGIVGTHKVVVLDEIAHTAFDDVSTISMMKDYMESGQFARGGRAYVSDASIVMAGNIDVENGKPRPGYVHLFEPLPAVLQDTALLDRVHVYLPGWEIPVMRPDAISNGYGLSADYIGQVTAALRSKDYRPACHEVLKRLSLPLTQRDLVAVEKTTSGLIKLLHPDGNFTFKDLSMITIHAIELRDRVVNQLSAMAPGEFRARSRFA
jgi:ATP-dependent Lon protease